MVFKPVNLVEKLTKTQNKQLDGSSILEQVKHVLREDTELESKIASALTSNNSNGNSDLNIDLLETDSIFHLDAIKKICIDYRLRFLDSRYFKPEFPQQAISKIKALEKQHQTKLSGFKIVAPAKLLKLENADDPLLFVPIGNNYFYLVHKWGNDLKAFRKLKMLPFKNLENLMVFAIFISFVLTYLIPHGNTEVSGPTFWILFLFMFKSVVGIMIYYAFSRGKNVSVANWDSKYYNG